MALKICCEPSVDQDLHDFLSLAKIMKLHDSVFQSEQSIVAADSDVRAWSESGASLPDYDASGRHLFTAESFDA